MALFLFRVYQGNTNVARGLTQTLTLPSWCPYVGAVQRLVWRRCLRLRLGGFIYNGVQEGGKGGGGRGVVQVDVQRGRVPGAGGEGGEGRRLDVVLAFPSEPQFGLLRHLLRAP